MAATEDVGTEVLDPEEREDLLTGRPTKLTPRIAQIVLDGLRLGLHMSVAFRRAGVNPHTGYLWINRGTPGTAHYKSRGPRARRDPEYYPDDHPDKELRGQPYPGTFAVFATDCEKALADAEARAVATMVTAAQGGDWRAAESLLKRRWPERWREEMSMDGANQTAQREALAGSGLDDVTRMLEIAQLAQRLGLASGEQAAIDVQVHPLDEMDTSFESTHLTDKTRRERAREQD